MPNFLIIDDEVDTWRVLNAILRKYGLKTCYVGTLEAAKRKLKRKTPSLIFLDNHLPDGYGIYFIQYVRKQYPQVKIVFITGQDLESGKAVEEGADLFIEKPFSRHKVYEALKALL